MTSFCGGDNDENDYEIGYREGAAVAFGLMGMAEAIRSWTGPIIERNGWPDRLYPRGRWIELECAK